MGLGWESRPTRHVFDTFAINKAARKVEQKNLEKVEVEPFVATLSFLRELNQSNEDGIYKHTTFGMAIYAALFMLNFGSTSSSWFSTDFYPENPKKQLVMRPRKLVSYIETSRPKYSPTLKDGKKENVKHVQRLMFYVHPSFPDGYTKIWTRMTFRDDLHNTPGFGWQNFGKLFQSSSIPPPTWVTGQWTTKKTVGVNVIPWQS